MRNRIFIVPVFIFSCCLNWTAISFASENGVDPREFAIDRVIGGMEEGSRPLKPQSYTGKTQTRPIPGGNLSPSSDTHVTASSASSSAGTGGVNANLGTNLGAGAGSGGLQGNTQDTVTGGTTGAGPGGNIGVETSTGGPTEPSTEPASGGGTSSSIVNVDANVDLSGGEPAVDANLAIDTNADSLLDVDTSSTTDAASVDATVTEDGTIAGQDLTTTVNEAPIDAVLDAEVVTTDIPSESEATAGLEADVDPVTADSDVTSADAADGLSATPSL